MSSLLREISGPNLATHTSVPILGPLLLWRLLLLQRFYGRLPVGAPGRVAGGHLRRAQPSQVAHGCAPTGERLRGDFLVERNSFRFSVALVPFEQANRSAGKKRNEFRSTALGPRVLGKSQSLLMVAHQLASAYELFFPLAAARPVSVLTRKVAMDVMKCGRDQPLSGTKGNMAPFRLPGEAGGEASQGLLAPDLLSGKTYT